jgi:hypothetical protein
MSDPVYPWSSGQVLTAAALNAAILEAISLGNNLWNAGTVNALGDGLSMSSDTLVVTFPAEEWNAGTVTALDGATMTLTDGTLSALQNQEWNGGSVEAIGSGLTLSAGTLASTSGGVTSVALAAPAEFTVSGSPVTSSGTLTLARASQNANRVFAGPASGAAAAPTFRALAAADLPVMGASGPSHAAGAVPDPGSSAGTTRYLREDGTWSGVSGASGGTVTNIATGAGLSGGPISTSGTIVADWNAGAVTALGTGLSLSTGTLTASDAVSSVAGRTGAVTLTHSDLTDWASATSSFLTSQSWNAGTVSALGSGLSLSTGTLTATAPTTLAGDTDVAITSPASGDRLHYDGTHWVNGKEPYVVGGFVPGVLTTSQVLLVHRFGAAVTFPSNFGATNSGETSYCSSLANATGSTVLTIQKCPSASDPTSGGSWSNVGTITVSASGHAGAFSTTGAVSFAQGDLGRVVAPASADATFANVALTLAGDR